MDLRRPRGHMQLNELVHLAILVQLDDIDAAVSLDERARWGPKRQRPHSQIASLDTTGRQPVAGLLDGRVGRAIGDDADLCALDLVEDRLWNQRAGRLVL